MLLYDRNIIGCSSEIFSYLRKFSENVRKRSSGLQNNFGKSSKNRQKPHFCVYVIQNITCLLVDMNFILDNLVLRLSLLCLPWSLEERPWSRLVTWPLVAQFFSREWSPVNENFCRSLISTEAKETRSLVIETRANTPLKFSKLHTGQRREATKKVEWPNRERKRRSRVGLSTPFYTVSQHWIIIKLIMQNCSVDQLAFLSGFGTDLRHQYGISGCESQTSLFAFRT